MQRWACCLSSHLLSNVLCRQDNTAISLSAEVSCYGFGEWLHICSHHFRHWRPSSAQIGCLFGDDLAAGNRDLPYSVTGMFGVYRMDLMNRYPYFFLQQRLDHLKTLFLEALYVSVTCALGQLLMYFQWV